MTEQALVEVRKHLARGGALCKEFNRVRMNQELDWRTEQAYALSIIRDNDKLQRCDPSTIGRTLVDLGVMGLSLSPALREAYMIPYGNVCTASPSYMGLEQIAYRTGMVELIETRLVRKGDKFKFWADDEGSHILHAATAPESAAVTHAYCRVFLSSKRVHIEVMSQQDLMACREAATRKNKGKVPFTWTGPFRGEMYKKSVLRRAWKHLPRVRSPKLVAMMEAVDRTDPMDFNGEGAPQKDHRTVIDLEASIDSDQIALITDLMVQAGVPAHGHNAWLAALAKSMGYPEGIRTVKMKDFDALASQMKEGLKRWAEQTSSSSHESASAQEDTTAQKEAV